MPATWVLLLPLDAASPWLGDYPLAERDSCNIVSGNPNFGIVDSPRREGATSSFQFSMHACVSRANTHSTHTAKQHRVLCGDASRSTRLSMRFGNFIIIWQQANAGSRVTW
jgi:hypothetical protein